VDFFVEKLMLVLECNGYCHRYYNATEEKAREKMITQKYSLVRFHHQTRNVVQWHFTSQTGYDS